MNNVFKRLQEQAYDHLKKMVMSGEFERGKIYSETKTAEMLGISRTPVRDALQRLNHDGLVDIMPSKGFCVHQLTPDDIIEIYQMRCAVEGYCVWLLVMQRDTPAARETIGKLSDMQARQQELFSSDTPIRDFVELDYKFHMQIISYTKNSIFAQIYSNQMHRMRMISMEGQERVMRRKGSLEEHRRLIDILSNEDAGSAYKMINYHYKNMIETIAASHINDNMDNPGVRALMIRSTLPPVSL